MGVSDWCSIQNINLKVVLGALILFGAIANFTLFSMSRDISKEAKIVENFKYLDCTLLGCFDFSLCSSDSFRVSLVDLPSDESFKPEPTKTYAELIDAIQASPYYTANVNEACIFVPNFDTTCDKSHCISPKEDDRTYIGEVLKSLPNWRRTMSDNSIIEGANFLLFELHDRASVAYDAGSAMIAKSAFAFKYYRKGFDIAFPLRARQTCEGGVIASSKRKFLAGFKGTYTRRHDLRKNIVDYYNHKEELGILAENTNDGEYDSDEYLQLLANSKFALVPKGNGLHSYRLIEGMSCGSVPVIIADEFVPPFHELLDWSEFAVFIPESKIYSIHSILNRFNDTQIEKMQAKALQVYRNYFSSTERHVYRTLEIISRRLTEYNYLMSPKPRNKKDD